MSDTTPIEGFMETEYCFYESGSNSIFDLATLRKNGERMGVFGNKTLEQIQVEKPNMRLIKYDLANAEIEKLNTESYSFVTEITEERFNEMLNIMPPMDWANGSFLICEAITGGWHACFLKHDGKYYEGYSNRFKENSVTRRERFISSIK